MVKGLGSGMGLGTNETKLAILFLIAEENKKLESEYIIDEIKKILGMKIQAGIYRHLNQLENKKLLKSEKGRYNKKYWYFPEDIGYFKNLIRFINDNKDLKTFSYTLYYKEYIKKNLNNYLNKKFVHLNLDNKELDLLNKILIASPTAFMKVFMNNNFLKELFDHIEYLKNTEDYNKLFKIISNEEYSFNVFQVALSLPYLYPDIFKGEVIYINKNKKLFFCYLINCLLHDTLICYSEDLSDFELFDRLYKKLGIKITHNYSK